MNTSPLWAVQSSLLEIYLLLVHRIQGLGWSLNDFWEADTWITSKLYCRELDLIVEEDKKLNGDKEEYHDDEDVVDLFEEMYGID